MARTEGGKQMKKITPIIVALMLVASVALAANPMYCGYGYNKRGRAILIGYTMETVRTFCGTPYEIDDYNGYEVWTYINSLSSWDYHLTFDEGELVSIERY